MTENKLIELFSLMSKARSDCEFDYVFTVLLKFAESNPREFNNAMSFIIEIAGVLPSQTYDNFFMSTDVAGEC